MNLIGSVVALLLSSSFAMALTPMDRFVGFYRVTTVQVPMRGCQGRTCLYPGDIVTLTPSRTEKDTVQFNYWHPQEYGHTALFQKDLKQYVIDQGEGHIMGASFKLLPGGGVGWVSGCTVCRAPDIFSFVPMAVNSFKVSFGQQSAGPFLSLPVVMVEKINPPR